ncbi:MAG: cysteine--tRNA ligase [Acidobacteriaceae bacterium]|nr:cysteine--tRNA ligase [Acidobacteriaceae bacterium]
MPLRFYNTLTQELEVFHPLHDNTVRMYTCGPTVYNFVHIGNFRTFTFQDILRRWLRYRGYQLDHVMNVTDVDDKIIVNAAKAKKSIEDYTAVFTKAFFDDAARLRLEPPEHVAPATKHIGVMVKAIEELASKGCTYTSEGSMYFRIATFPEYGKLSHNDFSGIRSGARVDVDEYDKADARDFVLWKAQKDNEPAWDTPFGSGRPGWHIECSAMAMSYLGETLDIHAGGVDLIFPHHENEIAQSESISGKPFARYWLHAEHLHIESQKMSKSLGNFYTLRDLLEMGYQPEPIRYLLASVPYRKKLNFTFEGLKAATKTIERLRDFELRLTTTKLPTGTNEAVSERSHQAIREFEAGMDDDLNTAEALAAIFEYVRAMNTALDENQFREENRWDAARVLEVLDSVFDILKPSEQTASQNGASGGRQVAISDSEVEAYIEERVQAKKSRNFARADEIRAVLQEKGVLLEDTKDGVRWKRK